MPFLYFDFEYRNPDYREDIILLSWSTSDNTTPFTVDLRSPDGDRHLAQIYTQHNDFIWVAYNAHADLRCLLAYGLDIRPLKVIDAMAEARMVTLTHPVFRNKVYKANLLETMRAFGIPSTTTIQQKNRARDLILSTTTYSEDEWAVIEQYGPTDVTPLAHILKAVWAICKESAGILLPVNEAVARGEYAKASTQLFVQTKGFPVNTGQLNALFDHKNELLYGLAQQANDKYGPVFKWNKQRKDFSFNHKAFDKLIASKGYQWQRTASGLRKTDKEYFTHKCKTYPHLTDLYRIRRTREALRTQDLRTLLRGTYIKPANGQTYYRTFSQVTSRTSPLPTQGFLLNLTPWLRSIIRPSPGKVFLGADWSQQEVAVAAVLSGDENLLNVYNSGDAYLGLAKMAGVIPPEGTKTTHKRERDNFKAIQLGLAYGKGLEALSEDIYANYFDSDSNATISKPDAENIANDIFDWHQETFTVYWDWVSENIDNARLDDYTKSIDGWMYFVDDLTKDTQLKNFPIQAGGAALMRRAIINAWNTQQLDVVCSLHDAIYINSTEDKAEQDRALLVECMNQACTDILKDVVDIRIEIKTYTYHNPYWDPRGQEVFNMVKDLLGDKFV